MSESCINIAGIRHFFKKLPLSEESVGRASGAGGAGSAGGGGVDSTAKNRFTTQFPLYKYPSKHPYILFSSS